MAMLEGASRSDTGPVGLRREDEAGMYLVDGNYLGCGLMENVSAPGLMKSITDAV